MTDLRAFAEDRHRKVDDEPYGGGAGMVMMAPVVAAAMEGRREPPGLPRAWTVLLAPEGRRLDQDLAAALAGASGSSWSAAGTRGSTSACASSASTTRRFRWATSSFPEGRPRRSR